jgi:hypothetical protein
VIARRSIWFGLALALAGCVRSEATTCGDKVCPATLACARGQCVDKAVVTACGKAADGAGCTVSDIGAGTCQAGLCIIGRCGDGKVDLFEACDGKELGGKTCLDFGSTDKAGLACAADCSFDTSKCTAFCGDGKKASSEQCDGKDFGKQTCITEGYYGGTLACTQDCMLNTAGCTGKCGDGVRNGFNEECDGADFGGMTCAKLGYLGAVTPLMCTATCSFDPASCACGIDLCTKTTQTCVDVNGTPTCK